MLIESARGRLKESNSMAGVGWSAAQGVVRGSKIFKFRQISRKKFSAETSGSPGSRRPAVIFLTET